MLSLYRRVGRSLLGSTGKARQECTLVVKAAPAEQAGTAAAVLLEHPVTATSTVKAGPQDLQGDAKKAGLNQFKEEAKREDCCCHL